MVDVSVERGCMSFIPGSQRLPGGIPRDFTEPFEARPEPRWRPPVTVPLRAGNRTFHHSAPVHMSGANATENVRISLATVYMDAEAIYR
ncbi:hypothetical protein GCM10027089_59870 [Nocardia thraciensis]